MSIDVSEMYHRCIRDKNKGRRDHFTESCKLVLLDNK